MKTMASPADDESMLDLILRGAEQAFLESGFDLATMDLVAKRAGVARGSVYNHFASKEELFLAMMRRGIDRFVARALVERNIALPPHERLRHILRSFLHEATQPDSVEMYRIVVAMTGRFPILARTLQERGLARIEERIREIAVEIGSKVILDPARFAESLLSMVMGGYFERRLLNPGGGAGGQSLEQYVDSSIAALVRVPGKAG